MSTIVYSPGVWDLFHIGHLRFLKSASELGDVLIVGVPHDDVVYQDKGHHPAIPLMQRIELLEALPFVAAVKAYMKLEFLTHLNLLHPDILCVGQHWGNSLRHKEAERWVKEHQAQLVKIPYTEGVSTTQITRRIQNRLGV